jgi:hypothetical protein
VPNPTVCSASETSRCFDGIEHTSACLKPRKYCAAIAGFPQIRPGFGQTVSSHRQSPNRHPARATYPKCLVFPRGIAFAVPERSPMQLVVSSPSITQRGANFLGIFFYLKWSSQWRPRPDRSQEGEVREDLPALEQFREEAFEHSGDYCAQNCVPILLRHRQPSRNSAPSSGDCQGNGRRPRRKFREHLPLPADAPSRCGSRGYRFNVARHQR